MPTLDLTEPSNIIYMTERYEKESRLRVQWVQRNSKNIKKYASFKSEIKNYTESDITKSVLMTGMATTSRDHTESMRHRLTAPVADYMSAKTDSKHSEPIMMPVDIKVKSILLESRVEYLKKRGEIAPEAKYPFVESSNWKYGWKLNESEIILRRSAFGKINHTINSLKTRVGPQPDPPYYSSPCSYSHFCFH